MNNVNNKDGMVIRILILFRHCTNVTLILKYEFIQHYDVFL